MWKTAFKGWFTYPFLNNLSHIHIHTQMFFLCGVFIVGFKPFQPSCISYRKQYSRLFCSANQMTGFFMECNTGPKWIKQVFSQFVEIWRCSVIKMLRKVSLISGKKPVSERLFIKLNTKELQHKHFPEDFAKLSRETISVFYRLPCATASKKLMSKLKV